jgi:hypothetical protein
VFFEELIEQHRVDRFVAHSFRFAIPVQSHQVRIDFGYFLGDQSK